MTNDNAVAYHFSLEMLVEKVQYSKEHSFLNIVLKLIQIFMGNSADADGGPCSRVCAHLTLQPPIETSRNFARGGGQQIINSD